MSRHLALLTFVNATTDPLPDELAKNCVYRRAFDDVLMIPHGARPTDMPVEQPDRYELKVNLDAADALDVKVLQSILLRTDRVIEWGH